MAILSHRFEAGSPPHESLRLTARQQEVIQIVTDHLRTGRYRLEEYRCPCGAPLDDELIARTERYALAMQSVVCRACGTVRFNPYLDDASVADFYTRYYQEMYNRVGEPAEYFQRQITYGQRILQALREQVRPGMRVFEIGCGAGGSLRVFQEAHCEVSGCEYSEELVAFGRKQNVPNLTVGSIEELAGAVGSKKADLLVLHHVFEHLTNPADFLTQARRLLSLAGKVLIVIPDVGSIDRFPYPGGDLLPYLHIGHKTNFTARGLEALGARLGFSVRIMRDVPMNYPELWVELTPTTDLAAGPVSPDGRRMVQYLRQTERLHGLGLCRGQLQDRARRLLQIPKRATQAARRILTKAKNRAAALRP